MVGADQEMNFAIGSTAVEKLWFLECNALVVPGAFLDNSLDVQAVDTHLGSLDVLSPELDGHLRKPGAPVGVPVEVLLVDVCVTLSLEGLTDSAVFITLGSKTVKL